MKRLLIQLSEAAVLPILKGDKWEIAVLTFGKSKRPPHFVYNREAAQRSLAAFNGARVYANASSDDYGHVKSGNKAPRDIVGVLTDARVTDTELLATLSILPGAEWLAANLKHATENGLPMPYELSIDATGKAYHGEYQGEKLPIVEAFDRVSVDVVERGAAGGRFHRMVASQNAGEETMKDKLLALLKERYAKFLESKPINEETVTEDELLALLKEAAVFQPKPDPDPAPDPAPEPQPRITLDLNAMKESNAEMQKVLRGLQRELNMRSLESMIEAEKLPIPLRESLADQFKDRDFTMDEAKKAVERTKALWSKMIEANPNNRGLDIRMGQTQQEKVTRGIEAFFMLDPNRPQPQSDEKELRESYKDTPPFRSFKEAYIQFTGDVEVSGHYDPRRFTESMMTSDWANVLASTLNRRMVRDYGRLNLDTWRVFTDIVPLNDFRAQYRVRYGGYANLPTVNQGAPYTPLASPTDEAATYTPAKRGGTEDITREMIINDDVGAIAKIPGRMAYAAARTLHEFVYDFISPPVNPTIYDSNPLYDAAHLNTATTALDSAPLQAARLRMASQLERDTAKRLGIRLRYLVVPPDLAAMSYGLVTPAYGAYNQTPTYMQTLGIVPIVVEYWTDAKDWVGVADRSDVVGLEIGFVGGRDMPETFVSDLPNVGSWFTNDKLTYKIRHEYGGAIIDWRAFDGNIVT